MHSEHNINTKNSTAVENVQFCNSIKELQGVMVTNYDYRKKRSKFQY